MIREQSLTAERLLKQGVSFGFSDSAVAREPSVWGEEESVAREEICCASALQEASSRLWGLMQTSPSKCRADCSFLVGDQEFFSHACMILAWSRPLFTQLSIWKKNAVVLYQLRPQTFAAMLKFMYTGLPVYTTLTVRYVLY